MTFDSTINNLKHFIFIIVPFSIAATYVGVESFYKNFNIDVTSYLGFQDLTIIYLKYTIMSFIYMTMFYFASKEFFKEKNEIGYWDKTIFSTKYKRRIIPIVITIVTIVCFIIVHETSRFFLLITLLSIVIIGLAESSFSKLFLASNDQFDKIKSKDYYMMIFLSAFVGIFIIPISVGHAAIKFTKRESIIIHLDNNKIIDAQRTSNLKFIGKTSAFVFIQDSIGDRTLVFPMDKITKIEYCNSN